MEKLKRQIPKEEGPESLDDLFMELFTSVHYGEPVKFGDFNRKI